MSKDIDEEVRLLHMEVKRLLNTGAEKHEIITSLQEKGINADYVELVIENVYSDIYKKKEFWKHIVAGSLIVIATVTANYFSYTNAAAGSSYLIISGTFVLGVVLIARGIILFRK